jgi:hypothetical protein
MTGNKGNWTAIGPDNAVSSSKMLYYQYYKDSPFHVGGSAKTFALCGIGPRRRRVSFNRFS